MAVSALKEGPACCRRTNPGGLRRYLCGRGLQAEPKSGAKEELLQEFGREGIVEARARQARPDFRELQGGHCLESGDKVGPGHPSQCEEEELQRYSREKEACICSVCGGAFSFHLCP